jgi:hypothetical protein
MEIEEAGGYILTYMGANAPGWVSVLTQIRAGFHKIVVYPPNLEGFTTKITRNRARFQIS